MKYILHFPSVSRLEESRVKLFDAFFHWISRKATVLNDSAKVHLILKHAADRALEACSGLADSSYNDKIEEGDADLQGWLPISLVLRSFQFPICSQSPLLVEFYANFGMFAVRKCFHEISDWDAQILHVVSDFIMVSSESSKPDTISVVPLPFLCLATCHVVMHAMDILIPSVTNDGPRFHCLVELAALCTQIGLSLLQLRSDATGTSKNIIYGNGDEADRFRYYFEDLEGICDSLKKKITSVFSFPHFRRCKELIVILGSYYRSLKDDASSVARTTGSEKKRKVQSELSGFLKKE